MDEDVKAACQTLGQELKKDWWFFGGCGACVGLFIQWEPRLQALGVAEDPEWALTLFTDFVSINAFAFVFFAYLLLASIASLLAALHRPQRKLEFTVTHIEARLTQITSSILSFVAGLGLFALFASFFGLHSEGLILFGVLAALAAFLCFSAVLGIVVGRRTPPFHLWPCSLLLLVLSCIALVYLLANGGKKSSQQDSNISSAAVSQSAAHLAGPGVRPAVEARKVQIARGRLSIDQGRRHERDA
jgi:hypothetical protein